MFNLITRPVDVIPKVATETTENTEERPRLCDLCALCGYQVNRLSVSIERALRRGDRLAPSLLDRDRLLHGLRERLEDRLGLVMVVLAVGHLHVDVRLEPAGEAVEELREETDDEVRWEERRV